MIPTPINIGAAPNDGTGDPLRTIFQTVNANFAQVFAAAPKCNFEALRPPTVTDDFTAGYETGSLWLLPSRGMMWRCMAASPGGAVWTPFGTMDHPGYRPDLFYGAPMSASATADIEANRLYAYPVAILFRCRIKGLFVYVPTGAAVTARLGIYAHDYDTKLPGALIAEGAADVDVSSGTGVGTTFTANPELQPGIYWLASCWSGICAPSQVPANFNSGGIGWMWGHAGAVGPMTAVATDCTTRYTRDDPLTYVPGSPFFPGQFGAGSFGLNAPGSPLIAWRCE